MNNSKKIKIKDLILDKRVMTLAVSRDDTPWSTPVYFVWHGSIFFFFSNDQSRHIKYSQEKKTAVSIFQDSDNMTDIFGLQMTGNVLKIVNPVTYLTVVKCYVNKFNFLKQVFGKQVFEDPLFFNTQFSSFLYGFAPKHIFLSDNSNKKNKQTPLGLDQLKNCCD